MGWRLWEACLVRPQPSGAKMWLDGCVAQEVEEENKALQQELAQTKGGAAAGSMGPALGALNKENVGR